MLLVFAQIEIPTTAPQYHQLLGYVVAVVGVIMSVVITTVVPAVIYEMRENRKYLQKMLDDSNIKHARTCEAFTNEQQESRKVFTDSIAALQQHNEQRTERCFAICQEAIENAVNSVKPKRRLKPNDGNGPAAAY